MVIDRIKNAFRIVNVREQTNLSFIEREIIKFKASKTRNDMILGDKYYVGLHDILAKKREVINKDGELSEVSNLPNNKIIDNQYRKLVNQKTNYLLGKPLTYQTNNKKYGECLDAYINNSFRNTLKKIGIDAYNGGKGWMYVYYNEEGKLTCKRLHNYEVIPEWADEEHTQLSFVIRVYKTVDIYDNVQEKVEVYTSDGIDYYNLSDGGRLTRCEPYHKDYITVDGIGYNFNRIPIIPFKQNDTELSLLKRVKSLQDGINTIMSNFQDNMQEDTRNSILILVNYDGQNLGEFRKNLSTYGAVKVTSNSTMGAGDVRTLQVEVNAENYKLIIALFKKAIIENGMGYDAKDDRLGGNANQMNILSMYNDIDLDANDTEAEFKQSLETLKWFIDTDIKNKGLGDFSNESIEFIFNRDMITNETDIINNVVRLKGLISDETLIAQLPFINDPQAELEKLRKQQEIYDPYGEIDEGKGILETKIGNIRGKDTQQGSEDLQGITSSVQTSS